MACSQELIESQFREIALSNEFNAYVGNTTETLASLRNGLASLRSSPGDSEQSSDAEKQCLENLVACTRDSVARTTKLANITERLTTCLNDQAALMQGNYQVIAGLTLQYATALTTTYSLLTEGNRFEEGQDYLRGQLKTVREMLGATLDLKHFITDGNLLKGLETQAGYIDSILAQ